MELISSKSESFKIEKGYSFVVRTSIGEITMYGENINDKVETIATGPSFWNADKFRSLPQEEQKLVIDFVNNELEKLI